MTDEEMVATAKELREKTWKLRFFENRVYDREFDAHLEQLHIFLTAFLANKV